MRSRLTCLVFMLPAAALFAGELDDVLATDYSERVGELDERMLELEKKLVDGMDNPDWAAKYRAAQKLAYFQSRPDWSFESTAAYNSWVSKCHEEGKAAFIKLLDESQEGEQRRAVCRAIIHLAGGEERDRYCRILLEDPAVEPMTREWLNSLIMDNHAFGDSCWSWLYEWRHVELRPETEIQKRIDLFFKLAKAEVEERESDSVRVLSRSRQIADAYAALGDYPAAEEWYRRAMDVKSDSWLLFELAECRFKAGATNEAVKILEEQQRKFGKEWRRASQSHNPSLLGAQALRFLKGTTLDGLKLPRGTLSKPYPTPKRAEYPGGFAAASVIALESEGVEPNDARLEFFRRKLTRIGFVFATNAPYRVKVALEESAPVEQSEGYSLAVADEGAVIRARDRQGILWGLVSLIQLSRASDRSFRKCRIDDWPDLARRGYFGTFWSDCTEFTVMCKMNFVAHQDHPESNQYFSPIRTYLAESLAREFQELGLTLHYGVVGLTQCPQLPISDRRTFDYRLETFRHYAKMGAGIYWPFDDVRFPVIDADLKAFGPKAATEMDAKHINELFTATVGEYPKFSLIFCPPFYWGPDSTAWKSYPEDLYEYHRSVHRYLDRRVHVVWTGPRVKGWKKEKWKVDWYANLIGRKPLIFQNAAGAHNFLDYTIDVTDWNRWMHYQGFYDDITAYMKNSATPCDCSQLMTLADCLWNDEGYEAARSAREGVTQLMGDGVYEALEPGLGALGYFDKYKYGSITTDLRGKEENPALKEEKEDDLKAKVKLAHSCYRNACKLAPKEVATYGSYGRAIGFARQVLEGYQTRYGSKRTGLPVKVGSITLDENDRPTDGRADIDDAVSEME